MPCMADKRIELFARSIKERLGARLIRVVLFGSRARGDAQEDSDYDCLIVTREMTNNPELAAQIRAMIEKAQRSLSVVRVRFHPDQSAYF